MGNIVGALLCLYCRSGCQASVVASALTFHPPKSTYDVEKDENSDTFRFLLIEDIPRHITYRGLTVYLITTIKSTIIPVMCFHVPNAKKTIIYSHGNATDLGGMFHMYASMAAKLKANIVAYDYTGYGASQHVKSNNTKQYVATEKQTYKDIESVYDWVISTKCHLNITEPHKDIILYGQSVGSGPSTYLATKKPIAGLVIHSGIASGIRVLTQSRLLWCFDIYPNIDRIVNVKCPVFLIHGLEDLEVGFTHGKTLYERVPESFKYEPWWVPKRGHNNVLLGNEEEFFRRMRDFLEYCERAVAVDETISLSP